VKSIDLMDFSEVAEVFRKHRFGYMIRAGFNKVFKRGTVARPIFLRGLFPVDDRRILVGFSPASIAEIDVTSGALVSLFRYSDDVRVCPHGIVAVDTPSPDAADVGLA
jgi:hypothetical protein